MIKFGIVTKGKIPTRIPASGRLPAIALTLLSEFTAPLSDVDEQRLALIYRSIHGAAYSRMITSPGRFRAIDEVIEEEAGKIFEPGQRTGSRRWSCSSG